MNKSSYCLKHGGVQTLCYISCEQRTAPSELRGPSGPQQNAESKSAQECVHVCVHVCSIMQAEFNPDGHMNVHM